MKLAKLELLLLKSKGEAYLKDEDPAEIVAVASDMTPAQVNQVRVAFEDFVGQLKRIAKP